jgi:hypothetical protein
MSRQATLCVSRRNAKVETGLRERYRGNIPEADFKIFCVSNKYYRDHRRYPKSAALPYLNLSGIIPMRKHFISIVSTVQHREATSYMEDKIPAFLGSLQLWVDSGANDSNTESKQLIRDALSVFEEIITEVKAI